jgi:hypothetical protein
MTAQQHPPMIAKGKPPALTHIKRVAWTDEVIFIDGYSFDFCKFTNCKLVTLGGDFILEQCDTSECTVITREYGSISPAEVAT